MCRYQEYLNKYNERTNPTKDNLNTILDNQERVYLPFDYEDVSGSKVFNQIKAHLDTMGYNIIDYKKGLASKKDNSTNIYAQKQTRNNVIRMGKLLRTSADILKLFSEDPFRNNSKNDNNEEYQIVISQKYEDILYMSKDRPWSSCMNIDGGRYRTRVKGDLKNGTMIAYLIKKGDENIKNPLGRVLIKPYTSSSKRGKVIYGIDDIIYGNIPNPEIFKKTIVDYIYSKYTVPVKGWYKLKSGLYKNNPKDTIFLDANHNFFLDGLDDEGYDKRGYDAMGYDREGFDQRGVDPYGFYKDGRLTGGYNYNSSSKLKKGEPYPFSEHLTIEQYGFLNSVCGLSDRNISIDDDGFVNVDNSMWINTVLPELPVKFGRVKGFNVSGQIKSLKNFPYFTKDDLNITIYRGRDILTSIIPRQDDGKGFEVKGNFYLDINQQHQIKNLIGFPNKVSGTYYTNNNGLESLKGIASYIGGDIKCRYNKIMDLKDLEDIELKGELDCSSNRILSLEGIPKGVKIIDCSNNPLNNFKNIGNDIREIKASHTKVTDLSDLENTQIYSLMIGSNNLKDVTGLPNTIKYLSLEDNDLKNLKGFNKNITHLLHLNLGFNKLTSLEGLENIKGISTLELNDRGLFKDKETEVINLSALNKNCEIRIMELDLRGFAHYFNTLSTLPKIEGLKITENGWTSQRLDSYLYEKYKEGISVDKMREMIRQVSNINTHSNGRFNERIENISKKTF
jgi:hypothetical protein